MIDDSDSQLWRGVVNTYAGKYLGELTVRGNSALECHQRLESWFSKWFGHRQDVTLSACQLVTKGPVILLASGHRQPPAQGATPRLWPVDGHVEAREPRSVPPALRYICPPAEQHFDAPNSSRPTKEDTGQNAVRPGDLVL